MNNLEFTLDREPDNEDARLLLEKLEGSHDPENPMITTVEVEQKINTFFRLTSLTITKRIQESFPDIGNSPSPREVFLKLRELRNSW